MLKVAQLMMVLWLDWLMVTELEPGRWMLADPPTTVPPLGPAAADPHVHATSATAANPRRCTTNMETAPHPVEVKCLQSRVQSQPPRNRTRFVPVSGDSQGDFAMWPDLEKLGSLIPKE